MIDMCLAVPGKVIDAENVGISRIATVQFGDITRKVYLDFVPEVELGDYVLVHVGFAISRVAEDEAQRTYELLRQLQEDMPEDERL
jgi:hydrogenase expression/formation protein HypC